MAETKVARRYAKSLLSLGKERSVVDRLYDDMSLIDKTIRENRQLALLFKSPIINTDKKDAILQEIFGGKISEMTLQFLQIITRKKREYYIEDIVSSFVSIYKTFKGIQPAHVITATPIDEEIRQEMLKLIGRTTGDKVELKEVIDKDIIGGYILRWGDRQVDASVTSKLHDLKQDFRSNLYLKDY
jgi:F-type H+-transporting ATPase subunit delta